MKKLNPFSVGDSVICKADLKGSSCSTLSNDKLPYQMGVAPRRGDELVVDGVFRDMVRFAKYDTPTAIVWWPAKAFVTAANINAEILGLL